QAGKPLGSYGKWGRWCRDPLLTLGCKDPVDRISEVKATDPFRQAAIQFFEVWWEKHGNDSVTLAELNDEVKLLADPKAGRKADGTLAFNRNALAGYINRHVGTTLAGFVLTKSKDTSFTRAKARYALTLDARSARSA